MKSAALVSACLFLALLSGVAGGQGLRGGSAAGGNAGAWGSPGMAVTPNVQRSQPAPPSLAAPAGLSNQVNQSRQPMVSPQPPQWNQPAAQPQIHVVPERTGTVHRPLTPRFVVPPVLDSRWHVPGGRSVALHWRRDRFFKHRHGSIFFVGWPGYYVDATTVITEVAPGIVREERRYLEDSPTDTRMREPGQLAPFDPTPQEVVERMLMLADVRSSDVIYDLGSGDGRLLIAAAKKYGVRGVGFEIEPGLVKLARENARREGVEKLVEIRQQDFLSANLSRASVVTLYLSYDGNLAVREQLNRQLKPGARVVSYTFDMGDWPPKIAETYRDAAGDAHSLYLWEITARSLARRNSDPMLQPHPTRNGPLIIDVQ